MNLLKRIWNFVTGSPYDGANYSTRRGYRQNAKVQSGRFDAQRATRLELIRKSRDFAKNSGMFNRLCDLFELYTVGQGLQVQPSSSDPAWNEKARNYWRDTERYIDLTSRQPMAVLESLWAREWFVDGECFVVLTYGEPDADGRRRPRIKSYRAHQIGTPPSLAGRENIDIFDGIRLDSRQRIVSRYFDAGNGEFEEVEERFVVPIGETCTLDELHSLPFVTPVINEFQDLIELDSLEMEKAKWAAQRTDVISTRTGEMPERQAAIKRYAVNFPESLGTTSGSTSEADRISAVKSVTGVAPVLLRQDERMEQFVNNNPSAVTQQYYRTREEKACAGIGIPRILVFPEGMQGTVYRGALDMANAFFKARHLVLAEAKRRIYEFHMGWAIRNEPALFGAPKDWYRVTIPQPRAVNVDVGRNSAAALAEMQAGLMNLESWYGPLGQDWRESLVKIKEQQEFARSIGLIMPGSEQPNKPTE